MKGRSAVLLTAVVAGLALAAPAAGALSVETPLVNLDVGADQNGVDVGASVPPLGTEVDANVGVGEGGVDVGAEVNTPAGNVNAQVGQPQSSGGDSGSPTSGPGAGSGSGGGASNSKDGRAAANGPDSTKTKATSGSERGRRAKDARGSNAASRANNGAATLGPFVLLAATGKEAAGTTRAGADSPPADPSVVARLVAYIPTWLWVLFGLVVAALLATAAFALRERRRRQAADRMAMRDPLTGIANVKAFDDRMSQEWARARRYGGDLGLLLIDLDGFKEVNDEHGHAAGDEVLIATAEQLRQRTRESDMVARIGGDEFAVICPHTGVKGLRKLRRVLEKSLPEEIGYDVGLSIGVAAMRPADDLPSETIARADSAMYARKALRKERSGTLIAMR